jgi:hypothetical protein
MRRLPLLLFALVALGCGGGSGADVSLAPTDANVTGTFNLQTSDGVGLPLLAGYTADGQTEIDMSGDQIVIAADNTWTEVTSFRLTSLVDLTYTSQATNSAGTYNVANNKINFVMTTGGSEVFTGSVIGNTLQVAYNGSRLVYTR